MIMKEDEERDVETTEKLEIKSDESKIPSNTTSSDDQPEQAKMAHETETKEHADTTNWSEPSAGAERVDDDESSDEEIDNPHAAAAYDDSDESDYGTPDWLQDDYVAAEDSEILPSDMGQVARKTGVAAVGTTMTAVGLVMIPLPTPFGAVVAGSGMAVLGTEFPAAQKALEGTCNRVADAISQDFDEGEHEDNNRNRLRKAGSSLGKKAAPVIRKIGEGVEKETLQRNIAKVTNSASTATAAVHRNTVGLWKKMILLVKNNQQKLQLLKQEKLEEEIARMQEIMNEKVKKEIQVEDLDSSMDYDQPSFDFGEPGLNSTDSINETKFAKSPSASAQVKLSEDTGLRSIPLDDVDQKSIPDGLD